MSSPKFLFLVASFLFATPAFASHLLITFPQDEQIDPARSVSQNVRPGDKVSLVAALYELPVGGLDKGHRAEEFDWQPSCNASSSACPTVSMIAGSVVVTVNIPICFPVGSTTFTVSMPNPPEGESAPASATVTLTNTEAPSICPGDSGKDFSKKSSGSSSSASDSTDSQAKAAEAGSKGSNGQSGRSGGGYGSYGSDPRQQMLAQQRAWAERNGYGEEPVYSNGSQRGFNYGDQGDGANVVSCAYQGNRLLCSSVKASKPAQRFQKKKKLPARKAKAVAKKRRR